MKETTQLPHLFAVKFLETVGIQRLRACIFFVKNRQQGDETAEARKELLMDQRRQLMERMEDMQRSLDRLNQKIEHYERLNQKGQTLRREES